jgi:hypothetical protein
MLDDLLTLLLLRMPMWARGRWYREVCRRAMEHWHPELRSDWEWKLDHGRSAIPAEQRRILVELLPESWDRDEFAPGRPWTPLDPGCFFYERTWWAGWESAFTHAPEQATKTVAARAARLREGR